jgi:hypothetical protein
MAAYQQQQVAVNGRSMPNVVAAVIMPTNHAHYDSQQWLCLSILV